MSMEENKAIVRRWVEVACNNGEVGVADGMYAPDYVLYGTAGPEPVRGPEGIKDYVRMFRTGLPDFHFTIEEMVAEGEKVVWRFTLRGTHRGAFLGIPPTGRPVNVSGIVISRFAGGLWQEDHCNFDALGMLQQLGVIPAPEPSAV